MNRDHRIDDALRAIAQTDASRGFSDQVRSRIEAGDAMPTAWWARTVTAVAALLVVVAAAWWLRETPGSSQVHVAQAPVPVVTAPPAAPTRRPEPPVQPHDVHGRQQVSVARGAVARVGTATAVIGDHEQALEPLSPLAAISLASVAPDAMVVVDHAIAPLAPIAPLLVHDMLGDAHEGEL